MDTPLCRYKDIFGKPGEGVHKYRLFNIAIVDTVLTIIAAWFIARWLNKSFWIVLIVLLIIGIIVHRLFCVKTTLTNYVFKST